MNTPSLRAPRISPTLFLLMLVSLLAAVGARGGTIDNRKLDIVRDHVVAPYPAPTDFVGEAAYALAAYYLNTNLATANSYIIDINTDAALKIPDDTTTTGPWILQNCLLTRIALGNNSNGVPMINSLSATAKTNLYDTLWRMIRQRSVWSDAGAGSNQVWTLPSSENLSAGMRQGYFLAAQALKNAGPPYGAGQPRNTLADGKTLQQHYDNWNLFWKEYFRGRAREGINVEVASPTYEKYSVACFYNIRDLAEDAATRAQGGKFLDLYWAELAHDFLVGATIRGGAACRMYQDTAMTLGTQYGLRPWFYMNDWHDVDSGSASHPMILCPATSTYVPPAVVAACATNANNSKVSSGPYDYTARRLGKAVDVTGGVKLDLPPYIRRDTYWTPEYVMGAMTYRPGYAYADISRQNRSFSMIFSNGVNDRIVIQGIGTGFAAPPPDRDWNGIQGACYQNTIIAARDDSNSENDGVRLFFSNGPIRNNLTTNGNWLFTFAGSGYAGIRVATGGYTWDTNFSVGVPCVNGIFLKLTDKWSPLVVQGGRAASYASYAAFQTSVTGNSFVWNGTDSSMTYTNEAATQFKIYKQNINNALPWVGAGARFQNPSMTYNSPYLKGTNGQSEVYISYPGFSTLVLDFDYP